MTTTCSPIIIGLDAGGSYVKATAFDLGSGHSETFTRPVPTHHPEHGFNERDAEEVWRCAAETIAAAARALPDGPQRVSAVGVTAHGNGLYLVDETGRPTHAAIQASDTRAAPLVRDWIREGVPDRLRAKVWNDLWPGQPGPLLSWLSRNDRETLSRSTAALMCGDYLRARLTGSIGGELTAWSCNGLLDSTIASISEDALCAYGIEDIRRLLPPLVGPDARIQEIDSQASTLTGLPVGTPVSAGAVDNVALHLGAGVIDGTRMMVGAGTWSINQLLVPTSKMTVDGPLGLVSPYAACLAVPSGMSLLIEASATSASTLAWAIEHVARGLVHVANESRQNVFDLVLDHAAKLPRRDDDVMFIPYLDGSRHNASSRGAWLGMSSADDEFTLLSAVTEGVCMEHRRHIEQLSKAGAQGVPLRLAGGASKSAVWSQLFADVTGRVVEVSPVKEIGAVGAAVIAGTSVGLFESLEDGLEHLNPSQQAFVPDPARVAFFEERFRRYSQWADLMEEHAWSELSNR